MMPTKIRTVQGDMLDLICLRHYRQQEKTTEVVLSANPGLASEPQPFRAGIEIITPDYTPPDLRQMTVKLWE